MANTDRALQRVERLSQRLRDAEAKADVLRAQLGAEAQAAYDAGAKITHIAEAMSVTRQRVQQLLLRR